MLYKRSRLALRNPNNLEQTTSASPSLRMAIFYDRANILERSRQLISGLAQTLEANRAIQFTAWRFDTLNDSTLANSINTSLQTSEIAMLAADAAAPLPAIVEQKLEQWLAKAPAPNRALFVFLEGSSTQARSSGLPFDRLQTLAGRHGVDFFAHIVEPETSVPAVPSLPEVPLAI